MGSDMILAADNAGGGGGMSLLFLLAVPIIFYFLLIRPQNKRRREQLQMQSSLEPGAKVITTAGMHATLVAIDDDGIELEIAPGVTARFLKQAVMQVVPEETADELTDDDDDDDATDGAAAKIDLAKDDARATADADDADETRSVSTGKGADKPSA
ncbi:preprotein translocase subunit YajC [Actinomadura flavalba]|uniref:preprotein translocase subunit YajC n=1 Tax=Actinomadura flavalba TaxID=1120938 RepID=UPI00036522E4|nr:preprotein translocase subunit YajC [Actinomadura flavalba]